MTVLIDTCVILDFLQKRESFCDEAYLIMRFAAEGVFTGCITVQSANDIYDLTYSCTQSEQKSRTTINKLLSILGLLSTTAEDVICAVSSDIPEFKDAVLVETGLRNKVDCLVTRNLENFEKASLPVYTPSEFLQMLEKEKDNGKNEDLQ